LHVSPSPLLIRLAAHPPESIAVSAHDGAQASYGALARRSGAAANALAAHGVRAGRTVAFLIEPGATYVETLLAIWRAGGLAVPLSPLHTAPELAHLVQDAAPLVLVASEVLAPRLASHASPSTGQEVVRAEALASFSAGGAERPTAAAQSAAVRAPVPNDLPDAAADALMLYTSGTTGRPKGVRLTHAALAATVTSLEEAWRWRRDDRLLHVLPLHHTHGLIVALLGALWAGAETRFMPFEAAGVWSALAQASVFMAVPTIYAKLLAAHDAATSDARAQWASAARGLRLCTSGSASLPASTLEAFRQATGQTILERYGMTEIGMALSNPYDGPRMPGAVGRELPGVSVDIVDEAGRRAAVGEPGELRVRTPQMFSAYHGDAAATAASLDEDGRFRTGDTGTRDADGVVRLLGRTSIDIIKSGGYKLSALEIEAVLLEHPAVAEAAVTGVPDATWGERVTAWVVARGPQPPTLSELQAFARERLAPYKLPRALELVAELPRNAMGKVQKQRLSAPPTTGDGR
jgi:malonyl-CoA/methylmalonyl-CoA synthetase